MEPDTLEGNDTFVESEDHTLTAGHPQEDIAAVVAAAVDSEGQDRAVLAQQAMDFFLADENDVENIPLEEDIDVKRMVDGEEIIVFTGRIRTITEPELRSIRERSREKQVRGVRGEGETDEFRYYTLLCATALIVPNLQSRELVQKFKTPEIAIRKRLLPGERVSLGMFILDRSGFGESVTSSAKKNKTEKELDAAKN